MRTLLIDARGADPALGGVERHVRDLGADLGVGAHTSDGMNAFPQRLLSLIHI